ncbi:dTDP-4-dehydrorhamnose reductase [Luteibacter anthropi]|uniref:dTDP-4-dehydrorhamnose reductase n=1 Tax=Luteibacter anthropi TaxID=564369 RepID=UPI002033135E|nr:dTDP-4-dehydrorhamnose reductase [Luteibacter anthropi]URX63046.1 dTDP-4-dehydrorhamnose reductase [Luteibacter anthropi]
MKILLLGADGQLGWHLRPHLPKLGRLICASRQGHGTDTACDLGDESAVRRLLRQTAPNVIVNAAAYTAVDRAEDDVEAAYVLNAHLPAWLGEEARCIGASVIHFSTDYVFDGNFSQPITEDNEPSPLNVYGRTKLAGESALSNSGAHHLILRTAWVYSLRGHNFLTTMLRLSKERSELRIVDDQRGNPTSAKLLAWASTEVADRWLHQSRTEMAPSGTWHLTATGNCTWFDFAGAIFMRARAMGWMSHDVKVLPIPSVEFPTRASRPRYSVLDTSRIQTAFGISIPDWTTGLDETMADLSRPVHRD